MSKKKSDHWSYKIRKQLFDQNPCIETARPVFIACRKLNISIPEEVLDILYNQIKKDHEEWIKKAYEFSKRKSERILPKDNILSCALRTKTLKEAYELYKKVTGEHVENVTLRRRLERFLQEELTNFIETQIPKDYRKHYCPIPSKLKDMLLLYRDLTSDLE